MAGNQSDEPVEFVFGSDDITDAIEWVRERIEPTVGPLSDGHVRAIASELLLYRAFGWADRGTYQTGLGNAAKSLTTEKRNERIRIIADRTGWTVLQLAEHFDVSERTIKRALNGS